MAEAGAGNKMLTPGQKQQKRHLRVPFFVRCGNEFRFLIRKYFPFLNSETISSFLIRKQPNCAGGFSLSAASLPLPEGNFVVDVFAGVFFEKPAEQWQREYVFPRKQLLQERDAHDGDFF